MGRKFLIAAALAGSGLLLAAPALADNRAGIDAWTRGDYSVALGEWQKAADGGDADAMFNLGQANRLGRGTMQDLGKAERLYAKAAALGHVQAADNFGLLLFQRGSQEEALPYLRAASDRGDPRAQYLLGVAYFNGKLVKQDWVRAYALVSLSDRQGLAQASTALAQMGPHITEAQQREAATLASRLEADAKALRDRQQVALDLGDTLTGGEVRSQSADKSAVRQLAATAPAPKRAAAPPLPAAPRPAPKALAAPKVDAKPKPTAAALPAAAGGPWRIQLGAFGQPGNADALWQRVKGRPELARHPRVVVKAGTMVRLQAGGFASGAAANAACTRLSAAGITCIPVPPG